MSTIELLDNSQLELLGDDLDLTNFFLEMRNKAGIDLVTAITDATVSRTMDGASTLTVIVEDDEYRTIQTSGKLGRKMDVNIDGLWWTLVGVKKSGRQLTLTFEEREVNLLRYYDSFIYAKRSDVTRAQFVLRMIQEVKELRLKWVIPELDITQPISDVGPNQFLIGQDGRILQPNVGQAQQNLQRAQGIHYGSQLTVKGAPATPEQINNANIILAQAKAMGAGVKVQVAAINTAITESRIINLTGGDLDSVGVFQQRKSQGWPATRDVATDAGEFIRRAMSLNQAEPSLSIAMLCQGVQHSAFADGSNYATWTDEAIQWVDTYGTQVPQSAKDAYTQATTDAAAVAGTTANTQGEYYVRGTVTKKKSFTILQKENSWACMNRLASEVNWRAFCVSGVIYYISMEWLMKSKPFMIISEDSDGIDTIDYDYDEGKKRATATVTAHFSRWSAPPGSTVGIKDQGLVDGRWLVDTADRSLFSPVGTVTLVKPDPKLPEPTSLTVLPTGLPAPLTGSSTTQAPGASSGPQNIEIPTAGLNATQIAVLKYATAQLGEPYLWGGDNPQLGFDCSGLAMAAYDQAGVSLPHNAQAQYNDGPVVLDGTIQPADLVFFGTDTLSGIDHVGIYIGHNAMIVAPHTGALVQVQYGVTQFTDPKYLGNTRPWLR